MSLMNLLKRSSAIRHSNSVAAGVTVITPSAGVDLKGFDGCLFIVPWGAITAAGVQSVEVHQSSDDGVADGFSALLGSKVTVADSDDNKLTVIDVFRPLKRYVKAIVNRATQNSAIDGIIAIRYCAASDPPTHDATTVQGTKLLVSVEEGTA